MLRAFILYVVSLCQRRSALPTQRNENEGVNNVVAPHDRVDAPQQAQRTVNPRQRWARAIRLVQRVLILRKRWSFFGALLNTRGNSLPQPILRNVRRCFSRLGLTLKYLNSKQLCDHLKRESGVLKYKRGQ